jgi:hypothetical protein
MSEDAHRFIVVNRLKQIERKNWSVLHPGLIMNQDNTRHSEAKNTTDRTNNREAESWNGQWRQKSRSVVER